MRVLAHPFRLDGSGGVATVEQWSQAQAGQLVQGILSTIVGERPLAPAFGVDDPAGRGLGEDEIVAAVDLCEPDIEVLGVEVDGPASGVQTVEVAVAWRDDEDEVV